MLRFRLVRWLRYGQVSLLTLGLCVGLGLVQTVATARPPTGGTFSALVAADLTPEALLEAARNQYQAENYSQAVANLVQAQQQFQAQNQPLSAAVALTNLALAYQQLGQFAQANQALSAAFGSLEQTANLGLAVTGVEAQALDVQGQVQFAQGNYDLARQSWEQAAIRYTDLDDPNQLALTQIKQARALQALGLYYQARSRLDQIQQNLASVPDSVAKVTLLQTLSEVLRGSGSPTDLDQAFQDLNQAVQISTALNRPDLVAESYLSFGNLYRSRFSYRLRQAGGTAASLEETSDVDQLSALPIEDELGRAFEFYQRVEQSDLPLAMQTRSQLNQLSLVADVARSDLTSSLTLADQDLPQPDRLYHSIAQNLKQLPLSQFQIYGYIGLAQSLMDLRQAGQIALTDEAIFDLLITAHGQAVDLADKRSQSFALGTLGHGYELAQQWAYAERLSQEALTLSQALGADDISYRWLWQLGRIATAQGQRPTALSAYTSAFNTLQTLRSNLSAASPDLRFSFRDNVEPIYRELVALLLPAPATAAPAEKQQTKSAVLVSGDDPATLEQAREVMSALQLAELENFFQAACLDRSVGLEQAMGPGDALTYLILLDDRVEVLVERSQPVATEATSLTGIKAMAKSPSDATSDHQIQRYSAPVSKAQINAIVADFRQALKRSDRIADVKTQGQVLYDTILAPAIASFGDDITTLIFVLDGPLRSIPIAALYDGEHYLIEKYAIAMNAGLDIKGAQPLPPRNRLKVLAAGVKVPPANSGYKELPKVEDELIAIQNEPDLSTTILYRDNTSGMAPSGSAPATPQLRGVDRFTEASFNQQLNEADYQVVHLATHGQFAPTRQETYILSADAKISVDQLSQLFRNDQLRSQPVDLLVFSACRTATGDDRAVLGLAGATVQAGARSAIAPLWSVDDAASVSFAQSLYEYLGRPDLNRAQALQQAQKDLIKNYNGKTRIWAPYILVGNWK